MSKFYLLLAFDALLFGTIAMSLDLLIGYTGLVSFGHAAFFGLGAYASAVLLERGILSLWACLLFAILVVGLYALVVRFFSTARRGIYLALPRALGVRDARPDAVDRVGRVHHHGHDRRTGDARRPGRRRRVLRPAPGEGLVVRGLVFHRDRPGPDLHRPVHAQGPARDPGARRRPAMAHDGVILEVDSVSKSFGALAALSKVSFAVRQGQVFSVIGPNGAGKSTLFNVLSGLHTPTAGRVRFKGREIGGP